MATTRLLTAEDLLVMPRDWPDHELVDGRLRELPPVGFRGAVLGARLTAELFCYAEDRNLGMVLGARAGFVLARSPDTVLAPAGAFIRTGRVPPDEDQDSFFEGAPDLAVEVLTASITSDRRRHIADNVAVYLAADARLVWVLDTKRRGATIHAPGRPPQNLGPDGILDGEDVVPGFRLPLADLFR
jgi:Uma2 family endonuclease